MGQEAGLKSLREAFDFTDGVLREETEKALRDLGGKYGEALARQREAYQARGDLKGVVAIDDETKFPGSASGVEGYPELMKLREVYVRERDKLRDADKQKRGALAASQSSKLEGLQARLTRENRIEEAKDVASELARIASLKRGFSPTLPGTSEMLEPTSIENRSPGASSDVTPERYVIDGDGTRSRLKLEFRHRNFNSSLNPVKEAYLVMVVSSVKNAETRQLISVRQNDKPIGSQQGAAKNERLRIALDPAAFQNREVARLEVACGPDAVFVNRGADGPRLELSFRQ